MKGKIVLITGATAGIGKATALALAAQGAQVILHGRDEQKIAQVRQEISSATGNNTIDTITADLFLLSEVRRMAAMIKSKYDHLDVLINNAGGIMNKDLQLTAEGHEKTIAVNLLAPYVLSQLLMPLLLNSKEGRIINVASNSHKLNAKPRFHDIELKQHYDPLIAYGNAKLFLIFITRQWSAHLKAQGRAHVTINTMHPGAVATNFAVQSDLGWLLNVLVRLTRRFFKTAAHGADTLIYLAASEQVQGVSGQYFVNRKPAPVGPKYDTPANEKLIWDYCAQVMAGFK
jgi:NAD(P)-dependent dehydrogenase (short-subunit alcohol dehydrogenase family)